MRYVALDSNVLIRDPWLRSLRTQQLLDLARKTLWRVLIPEAVTTEVKAHVRRGLSKDLEEAKSVLNKARKHGVVGLPEVDVRRQLDRTMERWETNFHNTLDSSLVDLLPTNNNVLSEAVRRATERLPPCAPSGEGMRDAVIWLNLLEAAKQYEHYGGLAFVSENTRDFAGADKASLRTELADDVKRYELELVYYPSLDTFLKEHAEPVEHITMEWVREHLRGVEQAPEMRQAMVNVDAGAFAVSNSKYRDFYHPVGRPDITSMKVGVTDYYVWPFEGGQIALQVELAVHVEAEMVCEPIGAAPSSSYGEEHEREISELRQRAFTCFANVESDVSAVARGEDIELLAVENAYGSVPSRYDDAAIWWHP